MDIRDAIEWLSLLKEKFAHTAYEKYLHFAISALEEQERDKWVPCKESLPEEGGKYRVTVKYQWGRCVTDCYWNNKYKRFEKWSNYDGCTMPMFEVVAWKPLEEPYEAEKES